MLVDHDGETTSISAARTHRIDFVLGVHADQLAPVRIRLELVEWAAFDFGDEMYVVRVQLRSEQPRLIGREAFLDAAMRLVDTLRVLGFTRYPTSDTVAYSGEPSLAQLMTTAATTRCTDACGFFTLP